MVILLYGFLLFFTHLISCIFVGFVFRFWKFNDNEISLKQTYKLNNTENLTFSNLGEILSNSITKSVNTIVMIGGFVVLFSVIISIINCSGILTLIKSIFSPVFAFIGLNDCYIQPIFSGLIELTNGLNQITAINTKSISITITIVAFLLGFGGLSVVLQVLSITSKSDISIKPYILGKILHGIISAFFTYALIHIFPIFNLDIVPIFSQNVNNIPKSIPAYNFSLLIVIFIFSLYVITKKKAKL